MEACSLSAQAKFLGITDAEAQPRALRDVAVLSICSPGPDRDSSDFRLRSGCGKIAVDSNGGTIVFDAATRTEVGNANAAGKGSTCDGVWGEPEQPCAAEISCSLCQGDADECTPAQLRGE